jgi:hypothetical protein
MKEEHFYRKKLFMQFFVDVIRPSLYFFVIAAIIILLISFWRLNPLAHILGYLISFSISFFLYMRKGSVQDEFKENI